MAIDGSAPILQTESLTKRYGDHAALDDLNLAVHGGEVFGYIGPNGAGKTTTFRILAGLLDPTSGRAVVAGKDVTGNKDLIKQVVGYLPDNFGVYPTLRVWEYLDFFAAAYRIPKAKRKDRIDYCLEIANAGEFRDKLLGALSRGMKQRVGIAKTLLHDPQVIILDEPAATIDPRARVEMRKLLRELADLGKAVLVSSHILPELADVCTRVGMIEKGILVADGYVHEVLRKAREAITLQIRVKGETDAAARLFEEQDIVDRVTVDKQGTINVTLKKGVEDYSELPQLLFERRFGVMLFREEEVNLETAFMELTKGMQQ